jgi:hypothetical protein
MNTELDIRKSKGKKVFASLMLGVALCCSILPTTHSAYAKDGEIKVKGKIVELSQSAVRVVTTTFALTASTKYENLAGQHISLAQFKVGDYVHVKGFNQGNVLVASAMEFELQGHHSSDNHKESSGDDKLKDDSKHSSDSSDKHKSSAHNEHELKGLAKLILGATTSKAKLEYKSEHNKSSKVSKNSKFRLKSQLNIPITALPDGIKFEDLRAEIRLLRTESKYLTCQLVLHSIHSESSSSGITKAEYKLDIREQAKNGISSLAQKYGECSLTSSLPSVKKGDTFEIELFNDTTSLAKASAKLK